MCTKFLSCNVKFYSAKFPVHWMYWIRQVTLVVQSNYHSRRHSMAEPELNAPSAKSKSDAVRYSRIQYTSELLQVGRRFTTTSKVTKEISVKSVSEIPKYMQFQLWRKNLMTKEFNIVFLFTILSFARLFKKIVSSCLNHVRLTPQNQIFAHQFIN